MSPKQWLALLCFYILYLLFGASVFYYIEHKKELEERAELLLERIKVNEVLVKFASPDDTNIQNQLLEKVSNYCGRPVTNPTLDEYPEDYKRTFYHAFWFAFIVCSTLGYGSSSPHDQRAQAFLIFFALIGLPLNGFVLTYLGDFFSKTFIEIYKRYKGHQYSATQSHAAVEKFGMISKIMAFLIPGIAFFIFLPACLFSYLEGWPYVTSVYYSFITLTTIGFGDYVPTFQNGQARAFGIYFTFYQIFIIFWNVLGIGYFIMIIRFIAKGMQTKRIARLEHQLSVNIRNTQHRIWTEVTKDLSFLRHILNEVNLMKFKQVYTDSTEKEIYKTLRRTSSCPELSMYQLEWSPRFFRKRAYSENCAQLFGSSPVILIKAQSDGDLSRIDKKKTFEGSETVFQTQEFLSNVLTALESIRPMNEDSQRWDSEKTRSKQSLTLSDNSYTNHPTRQRASSVFFISQQNSPKSSNEWTWNGNNAQQIKDYMKKKINRCSTSSICPVKSESTSQAGNLNTPDTLQVPMEARSTSFISKINPFKTRVLRQNSKRNSVTSLDSNLQKYLEKTSRGRESKISLSLAATENMELLEKTTIADLIRAIENVQAHSNVSLASPLLGYYKEDSRTKISPASHRKLKSLQVPANSSTAAALQLSRSRRGSLRPVPTYTTVFTSQNMSTNRTNSSNLHPESSITSSIHLGKQTTQKQIPDIRPESVSVQPIRNRTHSLSSSQMLQRTSSLRPSPLARITTPKFTGQYNQAMSETPIITVQPPDVTASNLLWPHDLKMEDGRVTELKNRSRRKRADSK